MFQSPPPPPKGDPSQAPSSASSRRRRAALEDDNASTTGSLSGLLHKFSGLQLTTTKSSAVVSDLNKNHKYADFVARVDQALKASFDHIRKNLNKLELELFSEEFWTSVFSRVFQNVVVAVCDNPAATVVRAWFVLLFYSKTTDQWKKGEAPTVKTLAAGHFDAGCGGVAVADKVVKGLSVPKGLKPFVTHVENNPSCLVDFIAEFGEALDFVARDAASPKPELTVSASGDVLGNALLHAMEAAGHSVDNVEDAIIKSVKRPLALSREGINSVGEHISASEQDLSGFPQQHEQQPIPEEDEDMEEEEEEEAEEEEEEEEEPQPKPQPKPQPQAKPQLRRDGRCNATSLSSGQRCKHSVSDKSAAPNDLRLYFCTAKTHRAQLKDFAPLPDA